MSEVLETTAKQKVDVHYVRTGVSSVVEETFEGYYIEHEDLSLEEVLQDQEIVYQSFQINTRINTASASSDSSPGHGHSGDERRIVEKEGGSSQVNNVELQLACDEALARALQELEDQLAGNSVGETTEAGHEAISPSPSSTIDGELNSTDTTTVVTGQDNIDPDNMTYEEMQSLGEAVGNEKRGLSDEVISFLPTFQYPTGQSSINEECVICCEEYQNGDVLITLPSCQHMYHKHCVTQWLKLNKACPVCKQEVFGS